MNSKKNFYIGKGRVYYTARLLLLGVVGAVLIFSCSMFFLHDDHQNEAAVAAVDSGEHPAPVASEAPEACPPRPDADQAAFPHPTTETLVPTPEAAETQPEPEPIIVEATVQRGQTASTLLNDHLSMAEIYAMAEACEEVYPLSRLRAGKPYAIVLDQDEAFAGFEYEIDDNERLVVGRTDKGYQARREPIEYEVTMERVSGTIECSLFGAISSIGESPALAYRLADIFAWEIDFIRDLRVGDSFKAVVEKRFREGEFAGYGNILAAQFVNQGINYKGYLYQDNDGRAGYFNEHGENLRKAFLKAPLSFSRISSGYTMRRLHPIKKVYRPHPAIDYAAPTGTPVKATGDGTVVFRGYDRGEGNFIKLRHPNGYISMYLHLSRFAKGLHKGQKVEQGQVIGYVGSTGMSTGPHLDFRMKRHGKYVNPLKIENERAEPLPGELMDEFRQAVRSRSALLDGELASSERSGADDWRL
jgi:murein DD-endopeptidase MepM/ murein hydrolase activator NlpD